MLNFSLRICMPIMVQCSFPHLHQGMSVWHSDVYVHSSPSVWIVPQRVPIFHYHLTHSCDTG